MARRGLVPPLLPPPSCDFETRSFRGKAAGDFKPLSYSSHIEGSLIAATQTAEWSRVPGKRVNRYRDYRAPRLETGRGVLCARVESYSSSERVSVVVSARVFVHTLRREIRRPVTATPRDSSTSWARECVSSTSPYSPARLRRLLRL